jgi:hypothetical protein
MQIVMKKIIILTIFLMMLAIIAQAQCNLAYKPLSAFANDTTAFMIYNFSTRELCYKGKTVNDVLSDLESSKVAIKSYSIEVKKDRSTNGIAMITSLYIYIYMK